MIYGISCPRASSSPDHLGRTVAYPQHLLCAFGGELNGSGGDAEIWQCGIRGIPGVADSYSDLPAMLTAITGRLKTWFALPASRMSSSSTLNWVKLNEIGPDGKYVNPVTNISDFSGVAGGVASTVPEILTLCISWTTGLSRGYAHRGRIYPPAALNSGPSMYAVDNEDGQLVDAGKALLTAVAGDGTSAYRGIEPRVVSSHGAINIITGVTVGNVLDVQRRRKNALVETYLASAWP